MQLYPNGCGDEAAAALNNAANDAMIGILAQQPPRAWHQFAVHWMNWDFAVPVGLWIVQQPECDLATAAYFLWAHDPASCFHELIKKGFDLSRKVVREDEETYGYVDDTGIIFTVLENWERGFYRTNRLQLLEGDAASYSAAYRAMVAEHGFDPFGVATAFDGPFVGERSRFEPIFDPRDNMLTYATIQTLGSGVYTRKEFEKDLRDGPGPVDYERFGATQDYIREHTALRFEALEGALRSYGDPDLKPLWSRRRLGSRR